jgi:hypothetical protein
MCLYVGHSLPLSHLDASFIYFLQNKFPAYTFNFFQALPSHPRTSTYHFLFLLTLLINNIKPLFVLTFFRSK